MTTTAQMVPVTARAALIEFDEGKIGLIKRTIAKGATDDELELFLHQARRMGLDPLARQIYFSKRKNKKTGEDIVTITVAIDGYRLQADRTGQYAGNDDPVFDDEGRPRKATVTVYKMIGGVRCPFTATARWDQYYPGDYQGFMWNKMPHLMLGKCAEALALRKAFPAELSGVYVKEEMEQAEEATDALPPPRKVAPGCFNADSKGDITWLTKKLEGDEVKMKAIEAFGYSIESALASISTLFHGRKYTDAAQVWQEFVAEAGEATSGKPQSARDVETTFPG